MFHTNNLTEAGRVCPACEAIFYPNRKDMRFCSPRCRKNDHSRKDRKDNPRNSKRSPAKWRENMELFDRHRCLVELMMKQPSREAKDQALRQIIDAAENGHGQLRTILTSKAFLYPDMHRKHLFFPIHRQCRTIAQMADAYSWSTWGCSLKQSLTFHEREHHDQ